MSQRYITLPSGKKVGLGAYVNAVKVAKAEPNVYFKDGFDGWGQYGYQVVASFWRGVEDRINQAVPYMQRGIS